MAEDGGSSVLEQPEITTIETSRLQLKTLQMSDLDAVMPIISSKEVMQFTTQGPVANRQQAERWLSARALGPDVFNFAIRQRSGDLAGTEIIGILGSFHWPEIGYLIHQDHAGRGYATEALQALIPAYFKRVPSPIDGGPGFDHVDGYTLADNIASQRILQKCGFTLVERRPVDFDGNPGMMASQELTIFRLARPGKTLDRYGQAVDVGTEEHDAPLKLPIQ
ncbi:N-acetyltransferase p20 [Lecanosticta acicola]|uniref:N-acetyltransferase p20 n=1 Tax=Lecanosticta acicola TaxID=111012 RepID=A0AAI9E8U0_9PEZI|nr:N-acetyltransferase p20 [Lecanosticta acicola]